MSRDKGRRRNRTVVLGRGEVIRRGNKKSFILRNIYSSGRVGRGWRQFGDRMGVEGAIDDGFSSLHGRYIGWENRSRRR